LAWENVFYCQYHSPDFLDRLLSCGAPDSLCATLDIKQANLSGYSPLEYADAMGSRMKNLHISDWDEQGRICMPGRGIIPFKAWFDHLATLGYTGPAIVEVYNYSYPDLNAFKTCVKWLNNIG
jgi:sugar phosphate isomerase/epimerase